MAKSARAFTAPVDDESEMPPTPSTALVTAPEPPVSVAADPKPKGLPSYRTGRRNLSAWIDEKAFNTFKAMVSEEGKTIQDYMIEMVNREFARKGRPQIAK